MASNKKKEQGARMNAKAGGAGAGTGAAAGGEATVTPRLREQVLRELHAGGGIGLRNLTTEVLFLLPDTFTQTYEKLFWTAFRDDGSAMTYGDMDSAERQTTLALKAAEIRVKYNGAVETLGRRRMTKDESMMVAQGLLEIDEDGVFRGRPRSRGTLSEETGQRTRKGVGHTQAFTSTGGGGKKYRNTWPIGSEKFMKYKGRIDQKLRLIAQDMDDVLTGKVKLGEGTVKQCHGPGCSKFLEQSWRHCPWCGTGVGGWKG